MADNPVVKDAGSKEANEKIPKKGMLQGKQKWYLIGGLAIIAVLVLVFVKKSNANANGSAAQTTAANNGINPATGYLYGSPADQAAQGGGSGGSPGQQGATGPAGPAGATGPAGPAGATGPRGSQGATPVPKNTGSPGTKPMTASGSYTVRAGDTLASVAARYGISIATLAHANKYVPGEVAGNAKVGQPLGTGAGLRTGQVLTIPNKAA